MASDTAWDPDPLRAARRRLAARFAALVTLLLAAGSVGVFVYVRRSMQVAFDATHDLAIRSALETIDLSGSSPAVNQQAFQEEFRELNLTLGVVDVTIWDAAGRELARASVRDERPPGQGPDREVRGEREHTIVVR